VKLQSYLVIAAKILLAALPQQQWANAALPPTEPTGQRFVCNTGYTVEKCREDIAVLRKTLAKYPVAELGTWTWILVRSEDWKAIVLPRGLGPNSPAFTYYEKHETFIEEALVAEVPVRCGQLSIEWRMSMPDLLDFAVAHELGHALCNEKDETKTNRIAHMLQQQKPLACEFRLATRVRAKEISKNR
jgi:hypothetical protein